MSATTTPAGRILLIEACDFERFPFGGHLTTMTQLIELFPDRVALVGLEVPGVPSGVWSERVINGVRFPYFAFTRMDTSVRKPLIPRRLNAFLALKHHRRRILACGATHAFLVAPEVLLATHRWGLKIAYLLSGVENPLTMPRYRLGKLLAGTFDRRTFAAIAKDVALVLAHADEDAIAKLRLRSKHALDGIEIVGCPSHVDTRVFFARRGERTASGPVLLWCGRLNLVKGWDLALAAFALIRSQYPTATLRFVGDGEDRPKLEAAIARAGLQGCVSISGYLPTVEVAREMNGADLLLLASQREGWPTTLVEALACGLPAVCTNVSAVAQLVIPGQNGEIVSSRHPADFAAAVVRALKLPCPNEVSLQLARRFSLERWRDELLQRWQPFR